MRRARRQRATALVAVTRGDTAGLLVHAGPAGDQWFLPGGGVERGELPISAVARELREETGMEAYAALFLFQHQTEFNQHHVFLVRARGRPSIVDPREVSAFGICDRALRITPLAGKVAGTLPPERLTAGTQEVLRRYADLRAARPGLFRSAEALDLPAAAEATLVAATRADWKAAPLPDQQAALPAQGAYSPEQMARIRRGFVPRETDDRWFAFVEGDTLHIHRSWTGAQIYAVQFAPHNGGYAIVGAVANRDPEQYSQGDDRADAAALLSLIEQLLLSGGPE